MPTYNRLCAIRAEQIQREQWEQFPEIMQQIYGSPERSEPEQTETGDKKTLTAPTKCGIIKAMRRHLRRWKQEGKTMKRNEVQELAAKIAAADTWNESDCKNLCELAGMLDEWNAADGETFETVVYNAAEKLGVEI
jgi:hypothetical protein